MLQVEGYHATKVLSCLLWTIFATKIPIFSAAVLEKALNGTLNNATIFRPKVLFGIIPVRNKVVGYESGVPKNLTAAVIYENKRSLTVTNQEHQSVEISNENSNSYLDINVIRKIINEFLTFDRVGRSGIIIPKYTKEELATALEISVNNLEELISCEEGGLLIPKINLPLIKLYCSTKLNVQNIQIKKNS